jgi:alkylhydroperoxidase family enzyme
MVTGDDKGRGSSARLAPADGHDDELAPYRLPDGRPLELFAVLAHSTAALGDLRSATARALQATVLTVRQRELIILRVLHRIGADSEIAVHLALFGAEAGLDEPASAALADDELDLGPLEHDLVALADAMTAGGDIDDALWSRLLSALGVGGLVDALFIATQYVKVALLVRALRIPIPEESA